MPEEDLEKTVVLESLEELKTEETLDNEVIEEPIQEPNKEKKKRFIKLKKWWKNLSKKKKIGIIFLLILFLVLVGIVFFFLIKSFKKEEIVEEKQEDIIVIQENYRYENGHLIFINEDGKEIGTYECKNKEEDLCYVVYFSTEDSFDIEKNEYEDGTPVLERTPIIQETFTFIHDSKKEDSTFNIYNIKENQKLEEIYQVVKKADNENKKFILKNGTGNYGIVTFNESLENVIPFVYDYLGFYDYLENTYISIQQNRNILLNETGKNISKGIPGKIKSLNKNYIKMVDDTGKYSIYDYNGTNIFQGYDYIEMFNDYVALIDKNQMNLKFYDGAKLNEEAIPLSNKDYVKTNIYDEDKNIKETKQSFLINEKNNSINIQVKNDSKLQITTLNKLEGLKSKTLKYMNYFGGKLYLYKDIEKSSLLGTYTCHNKNIMNSETSELKNCFIASDTTFENNEIEVPGKIGVIPILNNRYVFIKDNPEGVKANEETIVFYDLSKNKVISKYNQVNTYFYTGVNDVSHKTIDNLQIVAKNKNNKFGVIKISANEINSHVPFQYNKIEKIGNYYSAKNEQGYVLINKENLSNVNHPVLGEIKNYNDSCFTGIENNRYYVYSIRGEKLNQTGYKYIALYPNFFAGVNNENKLSLHLYEKPEENFLEKEITLQLNNYYGNEPVAFKISIHGKSYSIFVGIKEGIYEMATSGYIPLGER